MASSVDPKPAASRSCDECRTRKTKCDRGSPCSHCRAMNLTCRTTTTRAKEHKDRIHVTKQYETKMDKMDSRLANIERLLQRISSGSITPRSPSTPRTAHNAPSGSYNHNKDSNECPPLGQIGLRAESAAAQNAIDQTVSRDVFVQQDTRLGGALEALRRIVARIQQDAEERTTDILWARPPVQAAPTWDLVKSVLARYMDSMNTQFNWALPELKVVFCQKCTALYQDGTDLSISDKIFVYSTMSNVCSELAAKGGEAAEDDLKLCDLFLGMLLHALTTFPLLSPASLETAEALLSASTTVMQLCKPSLAWDLSQSSLRICQTLGYNRLASVSPQSDPLLDRKIMVFWSTYIVERATSLRLGRVPAIHDDDINTPMLSPSESRPRLPALLKFWVDCARVQGKIMSQLYGPRARNLPLDERAHIAEALAAEIDQVHELKAKTIQSMAQTFDEEVKNPSAELLLRGSSMVQYNTAAVALNAIPSTHPRRFLALEAARKCLRNGIDIREKHKNSNSDHAWVVYCHWMLLHSPITPFMSVFESIVAHPFCSGDDLVLLQDFVHSLQEGMHLSKEIEKFYRLCSIFAQVAQAYVQAKTSSNAGIQTETPPSSLMTGQVDESLASLGFFVPQTTTIDVSLEQQQLQESMPVPTSMDWFSGPLSLNGLLEQDFLAQQFQEFDGISFS